MSTPTLVPPDGDVFDPNRILATLDEHGVEYVLVGGLGARAYGASRETSDIDVVPRSTNANWERLAAAFRELGARLRVGGMSDEEARRLPVALDAATLRSFGSSTWMTEQRRAFRTLVRWRTGSEGRINCATRDFGLDRTRGSHPSEPALDAG